MADTFTEVTRTGFLDNIKNAIAGVLIGVVMFFVSFPLLWWNEGRTNMAEVAKTSVVATPDTVDAANDGKFVSITSTLTSKEEIGDPDFVKAGPWLTLDREVEMYAWKEKSQTKEEKELGGSTKKTTTYTYEKGWVGAESVGDSSQFKIPEGHRNPACPFKSASFRVKRAQIGAYEFAGSTPMPGGQKLALTEPMLASSGPESQGGGGLLGAAKSGGPSSGTKLDGGYLFSGTGSLSAPNIGDVRIGFSALARGLKATLFGKLNKAEVEPYTYESNSVWIRALAGTRDEAIAALALEHAIITWVLRAVGFFLMWIGMTMILGPISAVADVIPFIGSTSRAVIGCASFPIALVLTLVTIVISKIFHSPIALAVMAVIILALIVYVVTRPKKAAAPAAPPAPAAA